MNMKQLVAKYEASPRFKKLSHSSQKSYEYAMAAVQDYFGNRDIKDIKRSDLIKLLTENEHRPGSANLFIRVTSLVLEYALDMDMIPFNPAARLKKFKTGSYEKWTPEEVAKGIDMCDRKVSVAIALAWYTGQREGDILNMKWSDYDGEYIVGKQSKTNVEMKIKVHPDLKHYLAIVRGSAPDHFYIVSGEKKMKSPAFRGLFVRRVRGLGIEKTFHGIRKGVASSLAESGRSIKEIAAIMGHKTTRMAAYYAEQADNVVMTSKAVDSLVSVR